MSIDFQNGFALGLASGGVVEVVDTTEIDNLETLIDESGVLDSTEGTATEKVEQLIDKANNLSAFECVTTTRGLFKYAKHFPNKAEINLLYATDLYQAFSYWNKEPIPIVEELIINAPNVINIGQAFALNNGVKKVILKLIDTCSYMSSTFSRTENLTEVDLQFSTKQIKQYANTFSGSAIETVSGTLDFTSATNVANMFNLCANLKNVTFAPNTLSISMSLSGCSNLTAKSVNSIIGGLKELEKGAPTQTLTLSKSIVLTDEQKATIQEKRWTLAQ
jgi:hypothetical protein